MLAYAIFASVLCLACWNLLNACSVSVIIPTIGRRTQLAKLVESVLHVLPLAAEILLVDDRQAHHEQGELLPTSLHDDPRITILQGPRKGFGGGPRNVAIRHSKKEWLLFCDDDDFLHPNIFQWFRETLCDVPRADVIVWRAAGLFKHLPSTFAIPPADSTRLQLGLVTNSFSIRRAVCPMYREDPNPAWKTMTNSDGSVRYGSDEDYQFLQVCIQHRLQIVLSRHLAYGYAMPPPLQSPAFPLVILSL